MSEKKEVESECVVDGRLLEAVWKVTNENITTRQRFEMNQWKILLLTLTSNALFYTSEQKQPKVFDALVKLQVVIGDIPLFK